MVSIWWFYENILSKLFLSKWYELSFYVDPQFYCLNDLLWWIIHEIWESGNIYMKIRVSKYYSTYNIMIFPYKDYAESFEIKNMSSLNVSKSIIASYLLL